MLVRRGERLALNKANDDNEAERRISRPDALLVQWRLQCCRLRAFLPRRTPEPADPETRQALRLIE